MLLLICSGITGVILFRYHWCYSVQVSLVLFCSGITGVNLFRLRIAHNRLNAHLYSKLKVGESEMCPCNADIMTVEHLLQHCQLHDAVRRDMWPEPTLLRGTLYGYSTAAFVRATGISIERTTKKKQVNRWAVNEVAA